MRKALISFLLVMLWLPALAQKPKSECFSAVVDSMNVLMYERTGVKAKFTLNKVLRVGKSLDFYFSKDLGDYPWRPGEPAWFTKVFHSLAKDRMAGYRMGIVQAGRVSLEDLAMPLAGNSGKPVNSKFRVAEPSVIPLVRGRDSWPSGLSGRHIALWQSHGLYYKEAESRWTWQRAATHGTLEDIYTQGYVLPFLIPMLENAGAVTMTPRERDPQVYEVVCDNDPAFPAERTGLLRRCGDYSETGSWEDAGTGFADSLEFYTGHDNPFTMGTARRGSSGCTATWRPDIPVAGDYAVYVSYKTVAESTADAVYTVYHKGGSSVFHVNQRMGGSTWIYLGTFPFLAGTSGYVKLSGTSGVLTADAVRFGGGMGKADRGTGISGAPAYVEGALSSMQYSGTPLELFDDWDNDYTRDFAGRGRWVQEMTRRGIPFDCSLAFHTDAGITPDSTIVGTLGIYTYRAEEGTRYSSGESRMNGRLLTDFVQTQVVDDIRAGFDTLWTRRQTWDRSYSESRTTGVPGVLLELLSHQNFSDMRYGLDPSFRFTACRAVYKGILKYLSARYGCSYVVQPLPVHGFKAMLEGRTARLSWIPAVDSLELTAKPCGYRVYTRIDDGAFDAGQDVSSASYDVRIEPGHVYSFKVQAFNDGGLSFPSEVLAVGLPTCDARKVVIVNNFTRVSAPSWFDTPTYAGFTHDLDSGVPWGSDISFSGVVNQYRRASVWTSDDDPGFGGSYRDHAGTVIAGNTFDFVAMHGRAALDAGYAFESCSSEAFEGSRPAFAADIICGKQLTTRIGNGVVPDRYQVFTPGMQNALRTFTASGGNVIISGSYIGTDAWDTVYPVAKASDETRAFVSGVLGYRLVSNYGDRSGRVLGFHGLPSVTYNRDYSPRIYRVENPDGLAPASSVSGKVLMKYQGTSIPAAVLFTAPAAAPTYRCASFGFPLEASSDLGGLIKATLALF